MDLLKTCLRLVPTWRQLQHFFSYRYNQTDLYRLVSSHVVIPADEVAVLLIDMDRVAVAVRHVAQSLLVNGDVGRQLEWYRRWRLELADADACSYVMLRYALLTL